MVLNPSFQDDYSERIVYQRNLGHLEMLNSHRWKEVSSIDCQICRKETYTIVVWNKQLAMEQLRYNRKKNRNNDEMPQYYFKHSNLEAVKLNFDQYKHPVLYFGETMHKMV